jgi:hypothetical protein
MNTDYTFLIGIVCFLSGATMLWFAGYYKGKEIAKKEKDDDSFADMEKTQIGLSKEDWELLNKAIKDNPEPSEKIRQLFKKYKK